MHWFLNTWKDVLINEFGTKIYISYDEVPTYHIRLDRLGHKNSFVVLNTCDSLADAKAIIIKLANHLDTYYV